MRIVTARTRLAVQPWHRFEVVIHDVRRRRAQELERALQPTAEVGDQDFDPRLRRQGPHGADAIDEMLRAAVAQIVAIHARDHDIGQIQP